MKKTVTTSFRGYHLFIGLLLVITGMALLGGGLLLGGGFVLAGLLVPSIPLIGDKYAAKRDQDD